MLRRYPDAIRTFVSILNFILRMRQYHTRSYQYDQVLRDCKAPLMLANVVIIDQQNCRPNVCLVRYLQRDFPNPDRRQYI